MCPACLTTTLALITAGVGSAGGVAAVIVPKIHAKTAGKPLVRTDSTEAPAQKEESR
jgi:hypothetical protein